jgi:hypothetical protein
MLCNKYKAPDKLEWDIKHCGFYQFTIWGSSIMTFTYGKSSVFTLIVYMVNLKTNLDTRNDKTKYLKIDANQFNF